MRRLEAESLRDSLLFVSGRLDRRHEGLGIPLPLPVSYKDFENPVAGPLDGHGRRSIYLEARRNYPQLFLAAFDQPKPVLTVGERNITNVPAQSLALLNDNFVASQSSGFGERFLLMPSAPALGESERHLARIDAMYRLAFSRPATPDEITRAIEFLKSQTITLGLPADSWATEKQAWSELAHAIVNMKEFLYVR